jgi:hypothetical protein
LQLTIAAVGRDAVRESMRNSTGTSQSKWANADAGHSPLPRPVDGQSGAPTRPRPASQPWRRPQARVSAHADDAQISREGLRRARHDIGRRPDHFEMLLSPSRGVQDDESSYVSWRECGMFALLLTLVHPGQTPEPAGAGAVPCPSPDKDAHLGGRSSTSRLEAGRARNHLARLS